MNATSSLIERYLAVWNESDADRRRTRIADLWAPDGATCNRAQEYRGLAAIDARVTGAFGKWVDKEDYVFRARREATGHHDMVRLDWEMVPREGGAPAGSGVNVLVLNAGGRIESAYQFNDTDMPAAAEQDDIVERYVAFWNESDPSMRSERLVEVWAADAAYIGPTSERYGRGAIEAEAVWAYDEFVAKGFVFRRTGDADGYRNLMRFTWEMRPRGGGDIAAAGFDVIVLDDTWRIRADYQFDEPQPS